MSAEQRLLILEEISAKTRMPENTIRWKKHKGEMPFIFKMGKRLVAYEHELDDWIAEQRRAQETQAPA